MASARRPEPPRPSTVYGDDRQLLGRIEPSAGLFIAHDQNGKKLGAFDNARAAMRCICASHASRQEVERERE